MRLKSAIVAVCLFAVPSFGAPKQDKLIIHMQTSTGKDAGKVEFEQKGDILEIKMSLTDFATGVHGVHIHQFPKCDGPDFKTAGPHFNPDMKQHGKENPLGHHAGDMPRNFELNADNLAAGSVVFKVDYLSMGTGKPNDILANGGTSIVLHEKADDMKTDPSGNSGNRIACGVIVAAGN